ncbi:MAG: NADP-dependent malic enzyme [Maricaulis sp.]|jgi:malate dehydrogenase (oxaloacetate-decarboxylating)(NADP+)|uniref:NADP-dependent malic enzyme n=1 Tax=Maricaulis sp. TaxID=1486257 RepID=UPI001B145576|nr:NADP-dependent malic enzyme [Maricaulis sp.]MBO6730335.1 NADP-dependent malic enzyme [Maricaulis sp.]MBO6848624.1 NADP-dependent malic enzyme [Maricaulis sp.]MBO6878130.1 NADP-dependent malic enzyme [Maricaulis sp.]
MPADHPSDTASALDAEALRFHMKPTPGKIGLAATKPMATQRDLALAYSPGVAAPVRAIAADPDAAYDYTSKGNMVAVVSNGTAILGLGNLGAMASKPVMEGKAVLFKRFADLDAFDVEVEYTDPDKFIECVKGFGNSFGGINLEDIKAPECFEIERRLREELDIPVMHDDQHGTAIIAAAGLINACDITGRKIEDLKVVLCGAGAAGLSVLELIKHLGVKDENTIVVDIEGVVYEGRPGCHDRLAKHAIKTDKRTLAEAAKGADCLLGLSAAGVFTKEIIGSLAPRPIVFAMANPTPEITPEEVAEVRDDVIMATGRSDYPNQVNNVLGFPYIFRGALDVRATEINEDMKVAAARALAALAREDVPDEVANAYKVDRLQYGRDYIIPTPFDPRLIYWIPPFVAEAAVKSGVARRPIDDIEHYKQHLARRLDPTASMQQRITAAIRKEPKRIVFAEGEEPAVIRAAHAFENQGLGKAILIAREDVAKQNMRELGLPDDALEICNARLSEHNSEYAEFLYKRLQRKGFLRRDVQRRVNNDRNVFAACMLKMGQADGMVTGVTRHSNVVMKDVKLVLGPAEGGRVVGIASAITPGRTLLISDVTVEEFPDAQALAEIACATANAAKRLRLTPHVAFLSYSSFGNPPGERTEKIQEAVRILDRMGVDFEYEGEMAADVALDPDHHRLYPFSRLTQPANVLIMPAVHSASIALRLLKSAGGATVIGPMLVGLEKPVQIARLGSSVSDIVNLAGVAAYDLNTVDA